MTIKLAYNVKKPKFSPKIRNEGHLLLSLYISWSVTKNFPTETLLEMIDSSVRNPGEVEYDKQKLLQHQKIQVRPLFANHVKVLRPLHKNWPNLDFLMLPELLLIIFEFPRVSYTRIYHFQKGFNHKLFCYRPIYVQWQ